jgi:hypothetical protein
MKKLLVAIIAFLYISTSIGASVHVHYCMGKLADWGFGHNEAKNCSKCGMEQSIKKSTGCCKDKNSYLVNTGDQRNTESAIQMAQQIAVALPVSFIEIPAADIPSLTEENPISNAPPRSAVVAIYIRNCVFRI